MTHYYQVNNIYPSIQGEGSLTGVPMVVLRLQGCGVGCPWCDTKETWRLDHKHRVTTPDLAFSHDGEQGPQWVQMTGDEIATYIDFHCFGPQWVMLTGGEPAEQELKDLVDSLHRVGLKVALETSGTALGLRNADIDWVCVSPKIGMPGGRIVLPEIVGMADEVKHVVGKPKDIEVLVDLLEFSREFLKEGVEVCLQPVSQSKRATELCMTTCLERGWRLSVQVHKYLELA